MRRISVATGLAVFILVAACSSDDPAQSNPSSDGGSESSDNDVAVDSDVQDAAPDTPSADAGEDAEDASVDASADAPEDVTVDSPEDATQDVVEDVTEDATQDVVNDVASEAGDAGGCAPGDLVATAITPTSVAGAPPTMTGGTIVDGTYWAIAETKYNGATVPASTQNQVTVTNGGLHYAEISEQGAPIGVLHLEYDCTPAGSNALSCQVTCSSSAYVPVGYALDVSYTATATQLQMLNATTLWTYAKQ